MRPLKGAVLQTFGAGNCPSYIAADKKDKKGEAHTASGLLIFHIHSTRIRLLLVSYCPSVCIGNVIEKSVLHKATSGELKGNPNRVLIVNVTQCYEGTVEEIYATGTVCSLHTDK